MFFLLKDVGTTLQSTIIGSVHIKSRSKIKAKDMVEIKIESSSS